MLKRLFIVSFIILIAMAGQGMAVNTWTGDGTASADWGTAANWTDVGDDTDHHIPVLSDNEINISQTVTYGFPVIAAGESYTIHSFLLGWRYGVAGSLTMEAGSSLTCTAFTSLAHGGSLLETNVLTLNDATLITPALQVAHGAGTNTEINMNGQSSSIHVEYNMDTLWNNWTGHAQINLAGGLLHIGRINLNPGLPGGTWNMHITNIDAGTRFVSKWDTVETIQGHIDGGYITSDVAIYSATNGDGFTEIFELLFEQAREPDIDGTTFYGFDCTTITASWTPGDSATCRIVYISDDYEDVSYADASTIVADCSSPIGTSIDFTGLKHGTTYYWRVDESDGTTVTPGNVWNFTIAPYALVDNFDNVTIDDPNDDGTVANIGGEPSMVMAGSSSSVGFPVSNNDTAYSNPNSLQLFVNNNTAPYYTEAVWTFASPQDLSSCLKTVSVRVAGPVTPSGSNADDEDIYIRISDGTDSAKVVVADSGMLAAAVFYKYYAVLADFVAANAALDLDNIVSIAVGVGDGVAPTGTGWIDGMFIDNVRLNPCLASMASDFNGDCVTDMVDFAEFIDNWIIEQLFPVE